MQTIAYTHSFAVGAHFYIMTCTKLAILRGLWFRQFCMRVVKERRSCKRNFWVSTIFTHL